MKRVIRKALERLASNDQAQRLLERTVVVTEHLMGIGTGSDVASSGEHVLVQTLRDLHAATREPLCVFDVGSNKGQFLELIVGGLRSVPFSVHAFEPGQATFDILSRNVKGHSNVRLNNLGLGKECGEFPLFYHEPGSGLASLTRRRLSHFGLEFSYSETVRLETLDAYCREQSIPRIDLLKLDVEGHELDVLQGGLEMFRSKKVKTVSFEFGGCNIDSRTYFQDFWYFFNENGMSRIFRITPSGYLARVREYREVYEQFLTTNFLVFQS